MGKVVKKISFLLIIGIFIITSSQSVFALTSTKKSSSSISPIAVQSNEPANNFVDFSGSAGKGIGYSYSAINNLERSSQTVEFRLMKFSSAIPLYLGDRVIFTSSNDTLVAYKIEQNKIKEDIILSRKPATNSLIFSFNADGLSVVKNTDGYHLYNQSEAEIFFIPNPSVVDANGRTGSASLTILGGQAILSVEQSFLDKASYPITIDPTVIATYSSGGTGINSQRKTFFDGQNYWVFYQDGNYIKYVSSANGFNWSSPETFPGTSYSPYQRNAQDFSVINKAGDVYVVFKSNLSPDYAKSVNIRKGVISGTAINWQTYYVALPSGGSDYYYYPFATNDSDGRIWVSAKYQVYQNGAWRTYIRARRSLNSNDPSSWGTVYDLSDTSNTSGTMYSSLAPLGNGQIYAVWQRNNYVEGRFFDGNSWQAVTSIGDMIDPPTVVADQSGKVFVAFRCVLSSPHKLWYRSANYPYSSSDWSTRILISDEGDKQRYPSLSLDKTTNQVYAFYMEVPANNANVGRIRYKKLGDSFSVLLTSANERTFNKVTAYSSQYGTQSDVTVPASNDTYADVKNANSGKLLAAVGDYVYAGMSDKFDSIFYMGTASAGVTLNLSYWNGTNWSNLSFTDKTNNLSYSGGDISFTPPSDWQQKEDGYYYVAIGTATTPSTAPIGTEITAYKRYYDVTSNYSADGRAFAVWTEGTGSPYKIDFGNPDIAAPSAVITDPTSSATLSGSSKLITGSAFDNNSVSAVETAIKRESDGYYYKSQNATWTAQPTWNSASVTSGQNTPQAAWQFLWDLPQNMEATFTIEARATDGAANVQSVPSQVVVRVENVVPTGNISINNADQFTNETSVTIQNNVDNSGLMRFSTDGGNNWSAWESFAPEEALLLPTGDGTKTVEAEFKKDQDSTNVLAVNDSIILDTQAPVTGITSPANNNEVSGSVNINAIADDALSGTAKVQFFVNDQLIGEDTSTPYENSWDTSDEINGPSILYVIATDMLGNTAEGSSVEVEVNNPIPFTPATGIKDWLLLGPFYNPEDTTRLSTDYLEGENIIKPSADDTASTDQLAISSDTDTVDINAYLQQTTETAVYANIYVNSPVSRTAKLLLGSTGGIKAWVNGESVFETETVRPFSADEDSAPVSLEVGWNQLLIKTTRGTMAEYKFSAKIAETDGGQIPDLTYQFNNPFDDIIFEENFNQSTDALSWRWEGSDAVVEGDQAKVQGYFLTSMDVDQYGDRGGQADYLIDLDVTFYPNQAQSFESYIMFRATDIDNGYELGISESGRLAFYKKVSGLRNKIGPSVNYPLEFARTYQLEIEARESAFIAKLDNVTLLKVSDPQNTYLSPGKIGANTNNIVYYDNITVGLPRPQPWVIKGTVASSQGAPIPGLPVTAASEPDAEANVSEYAGVTADDGSYLIEVTDSTGAVNLSLLVTSDEYSDKQIDNLSLSPTNPEQTVDISLGNTGSLIGKVVNEAGIPITTAAVSVFSSDILTSESTLTDSSGDFSLTKLDAPGAYQIVADAFGYSQKMIETTYTVSPDSTATVADIVLIPAGKISGVVVDAYGNPVVGAFVSARLPESEESKDATTAPDGSYLISDVDAGQGYEVEAVAEGYASGLKTETTVTAGQTTSGVNFVLGLEPAYVARVYGEGYSYRTVFTHPGGVEEPPAGTNRTRSNYNQSYYPRWDTHQWMTRRAVHILENDGFFTADTLQQTADGHTLWYWVARGARRADMDYVQSTGYAVDHFHEPRFHTGAYYILTGISAADYAQWAFDEAVQNWRTGNKSQAMYLLGLSLHLVQDLRVPQHALPLPSVIDAHHEYEGWVEANKTSQNNPDMMASYGTITKDDFEASGIHRNPNTAKGWVDQSAHVARRYYYQAVLNPVNPYDTWDLPATAPLFRSAQRFSAGFLNFFFDQANGPVRKEAIKIELSWTGTQNDFGLYEPMDLDAHFLREGAVFPPSDPYSSGYNFGDNSFMNRNPDWGNPWGRPGTTIDNPFLDMDSPLDGITGKETVTLLYPNDKVYPNDTGEYTFKVHNAWGYVWDSISYVPVATKATVKVWTGGELKAVYDKWLWPDQVWTPFNVDENGRVTPVGTVETTEWQKYLPS